MDHTIRTGSGPDNDTATIDRADIYRALADALAGEPHSDTTFHMDATGRLTISSHPNSTIDIQPDNDRRYRSDDLDRILSVDSTVVRAHHHAAGARKTSVTPEVLSTTTTDTGGWVELHETAH